ncbi:MAG: T9SS type A sorting domain-containing protein [Bacteroidota bacterium]
MKLIYTFLFSIFTLTMASAQSPCMPDPAFADTLGVFPPPFDSISENPVGGIDKVACVDRPYEFVFTISIGDSLRIPNVGVFAVDSIVLKPEDAITGLPAGLDYACGTENCAFYKDSSSCVVITGTPDASNDLGEYQLTITGTFFSGPFLALEETIPGDLFPGTYSLVLAANNSESCTASSVRLVKREAMEISVVPNPAFGFAKLNMNVPKSGLYEYRVYNMLGRTVLSQSLRLNAGQNQHDLDLSTLSSGLYLYSLNDGQKQVTKRLMIRRGL